VQVKRGDTMLLCSDGLSGMVRFEEIREILKSSNDPVELCKALTERANQAGGHDNITVIVVQFDGEGLRPTDLSGGPSSDPVKYRKYSLPEESAGATGQGDHAKSPTYPPASLKAAQAAAQGATGGGAGATGEGANAGDTWHERGPHAVGGAADESIDIPGTHVPTGIVVAIVVGVVALLAATAFLLLR
jgi:protein phosphatase